MFPKLLLIIIVAGATAAALLVNRQQRIDTVHEISVVHQRILTQEQNLWRLQSDLAERTRPERVWQYKNNLGGAWVAIPATPREFDRPLIRIAMYDDDALDEDLGG